MTVCHHHIRYCGCGAELVLASSPAPAGLDAREYVSCTRTHAPETTHFHPMRVKAAIDKWEDARAALASSPAPAGLGGLPRLWWCSGWGTLNEMRYHGNDGPCPGQSCGQVAYVRDSDLRAATRPAPAGLLAQELEEL